APDWPTAFRCVGASRRFGEPVSVGCRARERDGTRLWDAGRIGPGPRPGPFSRARRASRASARRVLMFDVAESKRSAASRTCPLALEQPPGVLVDEPAMSEVDSRR